MGVCIFLSVVCSRRLDFEYLRCCGCFVGAGNWDIAFLTLLKCSVVSRYCNESQRAQSIFRGKGKNGKVCRSYIPVRHVHDDLICFVVLICYWQPVERGIAFPVCISVNEIVCHYTPLASEDKVMTLKWLVVCYMDISDYDNNTHDSGLRFTALAIARRSY